MGTLWNFFLKILLVEFRKKIAKIGENCEKKKCGIYEEKKVEEGPDKKGEDQFIVRLMFEMKPLP